MKPELWQQIETYYHSALEQAEDRRVAYLDQVCGNDADLRRELESLLARDGRHGIFEQRVEALIESGPEIDDPDGADVNPTDVNPVGSAVLQPGMQIGVYRITASLGAGGMGEVYRAHDTKLERDVAIKVLPAVFAQDRDRLTRFEREAKTLASLNHPHIAQIYGMDDSSGVRAIAMELVPGHAISGPLPLETVIDYLRQLASALEAAHRQGIVHRDLKPANVLVTPDGVVKVLDFGLARSTAAERDSEHSPTAPGMILGTAAYMAPEQVRGNALDARADIWAFGVLVYEISTGKRPFAGDTLADILANVLTKDPDLSGVPAELRRLVRSCLEKDPKNRMRDIGDWAGYLDGTTSSLARLHSLPTGQAEVPGTRPRPRRVLAPIAAIVTIVAGLMVVGGGAYFYSSRSQTPVTSPAEYVQITNFPDSASAPSLSPDGHMVAFIRGEKFFLNRNQIYVKVLPNGEARQLSGSQGEKYGPVFTPDGSRVAFTSRTGEHTGDQWDTWTVPVTGGEPTRFLPNAAGLTWMPDRRILFSEIMEGTAMHMGIVTAAESRAEERKVYFPEHERAMAHFSYASPDLKRVLVVEMDRNTAWQRCRLLPIDGTSSGQPTGPAGECTAAAWSPDGKWMYFSGSASESIGIVCPCEAAEVSHLWRQRVSGGKAEQITFGPTEEQGVAVAPDGQSLISTVGVRQSAVWIHDRQGERSLALEGYTYRGALSADGARVYFLRRPPSSSSGELWSMDLSSGKTVNLLPGSSMDEYEVSRDDKEVIYATMGSGERQLWLAALDRRSPPRLIAHGADQGSFGAPGEILFRSLEAKQNFIYKMKTDGTALERITNVAVFYKRGVSPDGEWVITNTTEGTLAVPVRGGHPENICASACEAWWSPDARFFYVSGGSRGDAPGWRSIAIPVRAGKMMPSTGIGGIMSAETAFDLPGTNEVGSAEDLRAGNDPGVYVFTRRNFRGNLFRIPLH